MDFAASINSRIRFRSTYAWSKYLHTPCIHSSSHTSSAFPTINNVKWYMISYFNKKWNYCYFNFCPVDYFTVYMFYGTAKYLYLDFSNTLTESAHTLRLLTIIFSLIVIESCSIWFYNNNDIPMYDKMIHNIWFESVKYTIVLRLKHYTTVRNKKLSAYFYLKWTKRIMIKNKGHVMCLRICLCTYVRKRNEWITVFIPFLICATNINSFSIHTYVELKICI